MHLGYRAVVILAMAANVVMTAGAQQPAVLRHSAFELTPPPGFPPFAPTLTADAGSVDFSSETNRGVARVQFMDFPDNGGADALFERLRLAVRGDNRLDAQERLTRQGQPALRLMITNTALNQVTRMECILVGDRLYRVWFIARTTPETETPEVNAFFNSFRIL